jgi:hypothetical protein
MHDLTGQLALADAARGVGRWIALELARAGAAVAIADLHVVEAVEVFL